MSKSLTITSILRIRDDFLLKLKRPMTFCAPVAEKSFIEEVYEYLKEKTEKMKCIVPTFRNTISNEMDGAAYGLLHLWKQLKSLFSKKSFIEEVYEYLKEETEKMKYIVPKFKNTISNEMDDAACGLLHLWKRFKSLFSATNITMSHKRKCTWCGAKSKI